MPPITPLMPPPQAPLDLPRLVMRRAGVVAALVLLLAVVLGLARMGADMEDEVNAALSLATLMAGLGTLASSDDQAALQALRSAQQHAPLRHLVLRVQAADGTLLLGPAAAPAVGAPLRWLLALHRELLSEPDRGQVSWAVPRPDASHWTVTLAASHESERREAMNNFLGALALLLGCIVGLLLVMRWNVRRAFAPLGRLLDAIAGIELHSAQAIQTLPTMPIRELEAVAGALRHLGRALDRADAQRRLLSSQVLTLQEDERARLARDLHDEFGQRLTALRVDAAWLARRVAEQPALKQVVDGMALQCGLVQQDIRALLTRLQPFGPRRENSAADATATATATGTATDDDEGLDRLVGLLQALLASWSPPGRETSTAYRLQLQWLAADASARPWPDAALAEALRLPRPLALTLYRISQEALTNVARHAQAGQATLRLQCRGDALPGAPLHITWSASDDGVGLPGDDRLLHRGNGLAGIQARVWAQGSDLRVGPARPGSASPGLCLEASFTLQPALPKPPAADNTLPVAQQ